MSWRVFGRWIDTTDNTNKAIFQGITSPKNTIVRAIGSWFVFYNDPSFTSIELEIYAKRGDGLGLLLATSTTARTKAEFLPTPGNVNAPKWTGFEFNYFRMKADETYMIRPKINGYTGSDTSHIAWMNAYPDPALPVTGLFTDVDDIAYGDLGRVGYHITIIGSDKY